MAVKKDGTRGGLYRQRGALKRAADLKTRRLAAAMIERMDSLMLRTLADMPDSDLDRADEIKRVSAP